MQLILPSAAYEESYKEYIEELGDEERYPFPLDFDHSDFSKLLEKLDSFRNGVGLPEGFVPATTYWLVEDDELIGVANLRHYLNDWLRRCWWAHWAWYTPLISRQGLGKSAVESIYREGGGARH